MIFRNHSNMLIYCSTNISDYYQCWKQLCCTIFLWKPWYILFFRIHRWIESSEEQHLLKLEIFCNIINAFTVTFDQFNAFLMNKSINFLFFICTDPKFCMSVSTKIWTIFNFDNNQKCFLSKINLCITNKLHFKYITIENSYFKL